MKQFGKNTLWERPAQPAELAPRFVFLASLESAFITAAVFDITGGAKLP